jgi:hypothetical protein
MCFDCDRHAQWHYLDRQIKNVYPCMMDPEGVEIYKPYTTVQEEEEDNKFARLQYDDLSEIQATEDQIRCWFCQDAHDVRFSVLWHGVGRRKGQADSGLVQVASLNWIQLL